jgi:hypothetical protein
MLGLGMGLGLCVRIMLIVVDRSADVVLPLIDLLMFLRGQVAAVRRAIIRNLTIDARLTAFDVPGLPAVIWPERTPWAIRCCWFSACTPGRAEQSHLTADIIGNPVTGQWSTCAPTLAPTSTPAAEEAATPTFHPSTRTSAVSPLKSPVAASIVIVLLSFGTSET